MRCSGFVLLVMVVAGAASLVSGAASASYRGRTGVIAFTGMRSGQSGQIYVMQPNGTGVHQLTSSPSGSGGPSFSANGRLIVFVANYGGHSSHNLAIMRADGSHATNLTPATARIEDDQPDFSPNGRTVVFRRARVPGLVPVGDQIYTVRADGSHLRRLTHSRRVYDARPRYSPDGLTILFIRGNDYRNQVYSMRPDGSHVHRVTDARVYFEDLCFSPDGKRVTFSGRRLPKSGRSRGGQSQIFVMRADGKQLGQLTHNPSNADSRDPCFSPDGKRIAFLQDTYATSGGYIATSKVEVMNADGSSVKSLLSTTFPDSNLSVAWQPLRP